MQVIGLPQYDYTRLELFVKSMGMDESDKVELYIIIQEIIDHFFNNIESAVEMAVCKKLESYLKELEK